VIAKTPQLERAAVAKLLECGLVGIQLPRTECREDLETLRGYLRFPPHGSRAANVTMQPRAEASESKVIRQRPRSIWRVIDRKTHWVKGC
jgi:2-keto-3-deoxy-L-rhamnonate aldolase RhmA